MQSIVEAFRQSLLPNKEAILKATTYITEAAKQPGYCPLLMQVAALSDLEPDIRQAALVSLSQEVTKRWPT